MGEEDSWDALVIGAGPAGSTTAILLARAGWKVALVEKTPFPRRKVCGEFVAATNFPLLENVGALRGFLELAGPEVWKVGLFTAAEMFVAEMPSKEKGGKLWGRALSREKLDELLLERARAAGASIWQPWSAVELGREGGQHVCRILCSRSGSTRQIRARIVIAAHGSWGTGKLPTQPRAIKARSSDLLAFKAHVVQSRLPPAMMPLLVFAGGYGGMVRCDGDRMSLSFCVRRDRLAAWRRACRGTSAAETVLERVKADCFGLREALQGAEIQGDWLSAGPIRPGIRGCGAAGEGIFLVGNAAGEAHPAIAEGISLALQSAWVLCEQLTGRLEVLSSGEALRAAHEGYSRAWRRNFAWRIRASSVVAHWAMRPLAVSLTRPIVRVWPSVLALGAHAGGKAQFLSEADWADAQARATAR